MISSLINLDILDSRAYITPAKAPTFPCLVNIPNRNEGFHGRTEILTTLAANLHKPAGEGNGKASTSRQPVRTFSITGLPGMGKTATALEFVHRAITEDQFDCIFWVRAENSATLIEDVNRIAVALGITTEQQGAIRNHHKVAQGVMDWLENPKKSDVLYNPSKTGLASWLVVFDGVTDPQVLERSQPESKAGAVLITGTHPGIINSEDQYIVLPPFTEEEATDFLLRETRRERQQSEWIHASEVARSLDCHPFTLLQMASVIRDGQHSFPEFLNLYKKDKQRSELFNSPVKLRKTGQEYHWQWDDLYEQNPLLEVLSLLGPQRIPESILKENIACNAWGEYPQDESTFNDRRKELLNKSLITRDHNTAMIDTYNIVQDRIRADIGDQRFNSLYRRVLCMVSAVWPYEDLFGFGDHNDRWKGPNGCDELFPHILALKKHFPRFETATNLTSESLESFKVLLEAAWFSIMRSKFKETGPLLDMAKAIRKGIRMNKETDDVELVEEFEKWRRIYHHHQGVLALHTNNPGDSLRRFKRFTELNIETFGESPSGKDQTLGVGWNELGNAHMQNGNIGEAEECFVKSIQALKKVEGSKDITISMPLINLAFTYWLNGRLDMADATFKVAYNQRVQEYGIDDKTSFA
jgi:hypothetical protein